MINNAIAQLQRSIDALRTDLAQAMILGEGRHTLLLKLKSKGINDENANLLLDEAEQMVSEHRRLKSA